MNDLERALKIIDEGGDVQELQEILDRNQNAAGRDGSIDRYQWMALKEIVRAERAKALAIPKLKGEG